MKLPLTNRSASSVRLVLGLLWMGGLSGVVAWSGCGSTVVGGSASTSSSGSASTSSSGSASTSSSGSASTSSASTSSSSSSGACATAPATGGCGYNSDGQPCSSPGDCCAYTLCDHMGGVDGYEYLCTDAGVWEQQ